MTDLEIGLILYITIFQTCAICLGIGRTDALEGLNYISMTLITLAAILLAGPLCIGAAIHSLFKGET